MKKIGNPHGISRLAMGMVQLMLLPGPVTAQIPCEYEATVIQAPLCPDFGWPPTKGTGMNERGDVVGHYNACVIGPATPFLWTRESGFVTLDLGPGVESATPGDISDNGIVVGTMTVTGLGFRGFVYQDGKITMLPTVTGQGWSWASAITSDGRYVVGARSLTDEIVPYNAYIWSAEDGFIDFGVMNGPNSFANDISDAGYVVGWTGVTIEREAFSWFEDKTRILGPVPDGTTSSLNASNNFGEAVGSGEMDPRKVPDIFSQPALWSRDRWTLLGLLENCDAGGARDIDNTATVVGGCGILGQNGSSRGWIWHAGEIIELNDLLLPDTDVFVQSGRAINETGLVLGNGFTFPPDAASVAMLLSPLEPVVGDLNADCQIGVIDLLVLLTNWGPCSDCNRCVADLDDNCVVGLSDLLILLANWS